MKGLSYAYPSTGRGVHDVDLGLERGTMTVVTGRIGAGKTTLLETILGLLPADGGRVLWNGEAVEPLYEHMVPPRCAYTPQVPVLFSETVRENVLLGLETRPEALDEAVRLAVLEPDVATLRHGLDTVVGPRGVRLSGGAGAAHGGGEDVRPRAGPADIRRPVERPRRRDGAAAMGAPVYAAGHDEPCRIPQASGLPPGRPDRGAQRGPRRGQREARRPAGDERGDEAPLARRT